ncbi:MAG: hypothetical protein A4E53_03070 [Pelotomaculum sp. PtaB.Bin104]|nr:MAG: hypothetical protein A4E53_03070 [Pelotomaculum sp. PtaB.Bin104]
MDETTIDAMKEAMEMERSIRPTLPPPLPTRCPCTSPALVAFIFRDVRCVNVFNGACEDWNPGNCGCFEDGPVCD